MASNNNEEANDGTSSPSNKPNNGGVVLNDTQILAVGLHIAGFGPKKLSRRTQERRFKEAYGCLPIVVGYIWRDIHAIMPEKTKLDYLFWALFFLKKYPTEGDMASRFQKDPDTVRKWVWSIIFCLQELKALKIKFPTNGSVLKFMVSVDGTDCRIEEPRPFDKKWFSQKFKGPAVKYEIGLDILTGECVWVSGPFQGSKNDLTIFREGLMGLIPDGFLAVADKAYRGEPKKASTPNILDDEFIRKLKSRIRARHETFNARLKNFKILSERFRHKPVLEKHKACFEAVAVIVQYSLELGSPLFTI